MNLIKGFIDVFYFEEMLHGSRNLQAGGTRPIQIRSLNTVNQRIITSPIASPIREVGRSLIPPLSNDLLTGNRFLQNVSFYYLFKLKIENF